MLIYSVDENVYFIINVDVDLNYYADLDIQYILTHTHTHTHTHVMEHGTYLLIYCIFKYFRIPNLKFAKRVKYGRLELEVLKFNITYI